VPPGVDIAAVVLHHVDELIRILEFIGSGQMDRRYDGFAFHASFSFHRPPMRGKYSLFVTVQGFRVDIESES
jgi:hypothetical protein